MKSTTHKSLILVVYYILFIVKFYIHKVKKQFGCHKFTTGNSPSAENVEMTSMNNNLIIIT